MSFYREIEVDAEIATLNERHLIFQASGQPTTKLKEKNGFTWVTRALQQRSGTTEFRHIQALLSDASSLRGRDATSTIGRRIKNRSVYNATNVLLAMNIASHFVMIV